MKAPFAKLSACALAALSLSACVSAPSGPSVLVLPGSRASFEAFQDDDDTCREFASHRSGSPSKAEDEAVRDAAVATAVGAAAGAVIGAAAGDAGDGAAIGGGAGLLMGAAHGAEGARYAGDGLQRRYDHAYLQCMYAKGHQVPAPRGVARNERRYDYGDDRWDRRRELRERARERHGLPPSERIERDESDDLGDLDDDWAPPPPPEGEPPPPPPDFE